MNRYQKSLNQKQWSNKHKLTTSMATFIITILYLSPPPPPFPPPEYGIKTQITVTTKITSVWVWKSFPPLGSRSMMRMLDSKTGTYIYVWGADSIAFNVLSGRWSRRWAHMIKLICIHLSYGNRRREREFPETCGNISGFVWPGYKGHCLLFFLRWKGSLVENRTQMEHCCWVALHE